MFLVENMQELDPRYLNGDVAIYALYTRGPYPIS